MIHHEEIVELPRTTAGIQRLEIRCPLDCLVSDGNPRVVMHEAVDDPFDRPEIVRIPLVTENCQKNLRTNSYFPRLFAFEKRKQQNQEKRREEKRRESLAFRVMRVLRRLNMGLLTASLLHSHAHISCRRS